MNNSKQFIKAIFVLSMAFVLSACLATLPESMNTLLGTKPSSDNTTVTSSGAASAPIVEKKPSESKRTAVPSGIFTETYENGDDFYENFRFEDYMPAAYSSAILSKMTAFRAGSQKYANEFEKNVAIQNASNTQRVMKSTDKVLPDYLAFKVVFDISPKNYLFDRGGFYLKPSYNYIPITGNPSGNGWNHKSIADSNLVVRNGSRGSDSAIFWRYGEERERDGRTYGIDAHFAKSASYFENFKLLLKTDIKIGYFEERTHGNSYSSRKSNEYVRIKANQAQFSEILKGGYPVGNSIGSVFYMGYALVRVNKNSFTCNDKVDRQAAYVGCELRVDPVKYVINNFLGKDQYRIDPEAIDLINDKAIFDRIQ
jgi:hypothetical protein